MGNVTQQPLEGLRVLDLSRVLAGPLCSMVLADLGAEVIKVERPGRGDDTREWGPPFIEPPHEMAGMSAYFAAVNRNKRSVTIDLARHESRELIVKLVRRSHVVIENFLPAAAAKLGLAVQDLKAMNPELIVCSISGFGRSGPWANLPGYDFVVQALSGLMSITGEPAGEPMKVGVALTDVLTGLYGAVAVLAALRNRRVESETNRAPERVKRDAQEESVAAERFVHLDLSLFDCTLASLVNVAQAFLVTGRRPERYGNAHPQIVPYQCFQTADGYCVLAIGNDEQFRRFCVAAGRDDLPRDSRFATNPLRVTHRAELIPELQRLFRTASTADWQKRLSAAEVPHAPVLALDDVFTLPQVQARQMVAETRAGLNLVASPIKVTGAVPQVPASPPHLGQHTDEVLSELGFSLAEIRRLHELGVT